MYSVCVCLSVCPHYRVSVVGRVGWTLTNIIIIFWMGRDSDCVLVLVVLIELVIK